MTPPGPEARKKKESNTLGVSAPEEAFEFDQRCLRQGVQLGPSPTINARQCKKTITSQWILTYKDGALFLQTCQVKPSALCRIAWPFKIPLACGLNCSHVLWSQVPQYFWRFPSALRGLCTTPRLVPAASHSALVFMK